MPNSTILDATAARPPGASARAAVPLTAASVISRAFAVSRENLWRYLGFTSLMIVPILAVVFALGVAVAAANAADVPSPVTVLAAIAVGAPALLVVVAATAAGVLHSALQTLAGRPVPFRAMLSAGFRRALPMVGAGVAAAALVLVGTCMLVVPGVILACGLSAVGAVIVAERVGPVEALRRSWALTQGHRGTVFGTAVAMSFVVLGCNLVAALLDRIPLVGALANLAILLLCNVLHTVWPAVIYHELRVRKEGAGTEDLAQIFE